MDYPVGVGCCGLSYRCELLQVIYLGWVNVVYLDRVGFCRLVANVNVGSTGRVSYSYHS